MSNRWLDVLPLPLGVIRDGCFTYVNDALLSLLATTRERMVGRSFFEPVVPEDRERIRERHRARLSTEPVPDSYEFSVLRDDGERRTVRIFVARAGKDVIFQLHDVTERAAREGKLLGLSRLGASVRALHGADGIWDAVVTGLRVLGCAAVRLIVRGELLVPASSSLPDGLDELLPPGAVSSPRGSRHVWGAAVDHALDTGSAFLDDLPLALQLLTGADDSAGMRERIKASGLERGVLLRVGGAADPRELLLVGAGWLATEDLPPWAVFGAQLTAALESARVIADTSRRNAELAILNRLATESGLATDLKALFEVGAREIISTFGYIAVAIYLIDPGGETATLHCQVGGLPEAGVKFAKADLATGNLGMVARAAAPRVFTLAEYDESRREMMRRMGQSVVVSVPLIVRSKVVGVMNSALDVERVVEPGEVELLQAMGAHFAAAVQAGQLIEDLRRSYAALAKTQEQLVERERLAALGQLAAAVAHEVRNPLGVLFNAMASLRKRLGNVAEAEPLLTIMDEEAHRLNQIVGDLLDFARPRVPVMSAQSVEPIVDAAITAAFDGRGDGIQVVKRIDEDLPDVPVDARLLRQALVNLALNALQSMSPSGTLTVLLSRANEGSPGVWIELGDTGPGIAAEVTAKMFEPFFTTKATGTGLGLAIVRQIVEAHAGELVVDTEVGKGTRVRLRLPSPGDQNVPR